MRLPSSRLFQGTLTTLLAVHLVLYSAAESVGPADRASTPYPTGGDQLQLSPPGIPFRINLVNLTSAAVDKLSASQGTEENIRQTITFTPPDGPYTVGVYSSNTVALIPCDAGGGFLTANTFFEDVLAQSVPAVILYSYNKNFCNLTLGGQITNDLIVYSTTNVNDWKTINASLTYSNEYGYTSRDPWYIGRQTVVNTVAMSNNTRAAGNQQINNGGQNPSPSTAVAMIILYSITGVITALFLVIIVTGAIRAHRHPERYGPRNVLGRPRQSRAKGIARAMLDTLPIVKFGDQEGQAAKPADVEMANTTTTDSVDEAEGQETGALHNNEKKVRPEDKVAEGASTLSTSGIAAAAETSEDVAPPKEEEAVVCSICTEDFEKGQDVRVLPCNHSFHPACVDPWLLNVSGTCPLCRIDLRPKEGTDANNTLSPNSSQLPPPLEPEAATAENRTSRRFSGFLNEWLNPQRMEEASREQRIAALRRFTEQRRQSTTEEGESRRVRRLTARLGETFGVRTRARGASPPASSSSASASASSPPRSGSVGTAGENVRSIAEESIPEELVPHATAAALSANPTNGVH